MFCSTSVKQYSLTVSCNKVLWNYPVGDTHYIGIGSCPSDEYCIRIRTRGGIYG